jgi:hypothetical protein
MRIEEHEAILDRVLRLCICAFGHFNNVAKRKEKAGGIAKSKAEEMFVKGVPYYGIQLGGVGVRRTHTGHRLLRIWIFIMAHPHGARPGKMQFHLRHRSSGLDHQLQALQEY